MANPTPWPEIQQHPLRITYILNGACDAAHQAQTIVARRFRERRAHGRVTPGRRHAPPAPFTRADVTKFFTAPDSCTATGKLDGTNVGIDTTGALFGRRQGIPATNDSYQKTPLANLRGRGAQVAALRAAVASAADIPELEKLPLVLYGELCVNKLYEYESSYASGTFKSWRIFGAAIQVEHTGDDESTYGNSSETCDTAVDLTQRLTAAGFRARCGNTIVLSMCVKLRAIVDEVNELEPEREPLTCVAEMGCGSLVEVVDQALTWMLEMRGEGLVLTHRDFGVGSFKLSKWKCAQEPQQKSIQELTKLQQRFADDGDFPPALHFLMPTGVVDMVTKMHAVATVGLESPFKATRTKDEQTKAKSAGGAPKQPKSEQDVIMVEDAIVSALTKFDSPEAYFARDERKRFTAMLLEEVVTDLKAEGKLKKLATSAVMKRLGQEFGSWKKRTRARDVAAA